jgi:hypothetical protein
MTPNAIQLSALSRLFSSNVFHEMANKGRSPLFARLFSETHFSHKQTNSSETVGSVFEKTFAVLRQSGIRNEYVYRAALTHNILLGRHSLNTASMLTEFRAGACKADLVILNGTATVYEIKSERDSLSRLSKQISNYQKVFSKIYIVASESHVEKILNVTPKNVGLMYLKKSNSICTLREATEREDLLCPAVIFESLRIHEVQDILKNLHVSIPDLPNTILRGALRELFETVNLHDVYAQMIKTLKRTRNLTSLNALVKQLPTSLQPAALSIQIRKSDHDRLVKAVNTPLGQALAWT